MLEAMRNLDLAHFNEKYSAKIPLIRKELNEYWRNEIPDPQVRAFVLTNLTHDPRGMVVWKVNLEAIHNDFQHIVGWPDDELQGKTFEKPTLFIRGENSKYIQESDMDKILTYFPKARLVTIPKAGHWVHADNPNETIECLLDFVSH
ncbi:hypothetical protein Ciccas_009236 [Cichlidogyrus casuarinus]|uniref:Uncharacterized protein n=1 Tax=Cichlidogyrus casuarinus TaxID=1844966 RepID=A0ABD2PY23_9PLAT